MIPTQRTQKCRHIALMDRQRANLRNDALYQFERSREL